MEFFVGASANPKKLRDDGVDFFGNALREFEDMHPIYRDVVKYRLNQNDASARDIHFCVHCRSFFSIF